MKYLILPYLTKSGIPSWKGGKNVRYLLKHILSGTGNDNKNVKKFVKNFVLKISFFSNFRGKFRQGGQVVASETWKIVIYAKFWVFQCITHIVPICSCTTLKHVRIYLIKLTYQGTNFTLFHAHPHTLEFSFGPFQTPKDQIYPKFTQKFENFDIA